MGYFTHHFDTEIALHPVGTYNYTVVYLPREIADELPFHESPRLRIEADVSGVAVKGAWQPSGGRWYLMLPKTPLRQAGLAIGSSVEVAFKLVPQDEVDLPPEVKQMLQKEKKVKGSWSSLSPGKQRALAHMVGSAKTLKTRAARLQQVRAVVLGELPEPWKRKPRSGAGEA